MEEAASTTPTPQSMPQPAQAPLQSEPVTPIPTTSSSSSPPSSSNKKMLLAVAVIVLVILVAGTVFYANMSSSTQVPTTKTTPTAPATTKTVTPQSSTSAVNKDTSDTGLDKDANDIDRVIQGLTEDMKNVDAGLTDKPDNLN